ncbi:MAG: hypothetical protein NUV51_02400 [Sulfuricaulis sp.]|nr:hypothetical protein [Sulfuricaulis sp.]
MAVTALSVILAMPVAAQEFALRNRVEAQVNAQAEGTVNQLVYRYGIKNENAAEQSIWRFQMNMRDGGLVSRTEGPSSWFEPGIKPKGVGYNPALRAVSFVSWGAPAPAQISPGSEQSGFVVESNNSLPGIVDYYIEGYAPVPNFEPGTAPSGPISGYHDLTAYGPGVVGKTIGPVKRVEPLIPAVFVDYVITLKHEAKRLGWIKNEGLTRSLDAKLDSAKASLLRGQPQVARNNINALINELKAQKDKGVSAEAYGLLYFNLEYLLQHL